MVFYKYTEFVDQYVDHIELNPFTECLHTGISTCSQKTASPPTVTLHLQRRFFLFTSRWPHMHAHESQCQNLQ